MNDSMQGTLLIVDDTPANVSVLYDFLTANDFKVLVAQDGKRAIQKVKYAQPDLVLLDIMMPGIDGFETCKILKADENTKEIPIIFMTALADTLDKVKGFKLGAADYITKPFQHEEVLARVNTQLKFSNLKKQLQTRTIELEKSNLELDAFARSVAHDLKNPVNAIVGYSEILTEDCSVNSRPDEEIIDTVHMVNKAGKKMINIIESLLLLAGVNKQTNVPIKPLNMQDIVDQVTQRLSYMIKEYQADIVLPDNWLVAKGYAPWIEEIWVNYMTNGMKYGGKPPRLELGSTQEDDMIRFWILDNGEGISEDAELFTPFTRLHTGDLEGHGLGLSIVKQIIDKLGGKVGVETRKGCGFYFTLPNI